MTHNPVVTFGTAAALIGFWAGQWFNPETGRIASAPVTQASTFQGSAMQGSAQTDAPIPAALTRIGELSMFPESFGPGSMVFAFLFWIAVSVVFLIRMNAWKDQSKPGFTPQRGARK